MPESRSLLAAKLLASVEVSARASNQHELNAGALRKALDLPAASVTGELQIVYMSSDGGEPDMETGPYTLYDSRESKPRPAEYRLYYKSGELQTRAVPGDILIISRTLESFDLRALIISNHTELGRSLAEVLQAVGVSLTEKFHRIRTVIPTDALAHLLAESRERGVVPDAARIVETLDPAILRRALVDGAAPGSRVMAAEAQRVLSELWPGPIGPDEQLFWSLEAETALFQHIEQLVGQSALDNITQDGRVPFEDAVTLVMSRLQSRKSRRGLSLQHHFAALLDQEGLPYTAQCVTEGKETPDFVMPGSAQYHNPNFPAERLRMVACKSVVRERWRQILPEAAKINEKYLLTLDPNLTAPTLSAMLDSDLRPFLPQTILDDSYGNGSGHPRPENVAKLLGLLRQA